MDGLEESVGATCSSSSSPSPPQPMDVHMHRCAKEPKHSSQVKSPQQNLKDLSWFAHTHDILKDFLNNFLSIHRIILSLLRINRYFTRWGSSVVIFFMLIITFYAWNEKQGLWDGLFDKKHFYKSSVHYLTNWMTQSLICLINLCISMKTRENI